MLMLNKCLQKWVCCLMMVAMPAALMAAETNAAMVTAKGTYSVNGSQAKNSTVMAGDRVETAAKSEAVIRTKKSAVVVPESSAVVYNGDRVQLASGQMMVMTKGGMAASMGDVQIKPAGAAARYEVSLTNGVQRVAALEGDLIVTNGTQTYTLSAGKQMTRPVRAAAPQAAGGGGMTWAVGLAIAAVATAVVIGVVQANDDSAEESLTFPNP
jgi:hypothetical protein